MSCECDGTKCKIDADDARHGTVNGYSNYHCRCEKCRSAWREYYFDGAGKRTLDRYRNKLIDKGFVLSGGTKRVRPYTPNDKNRGRKKDRVHDESTNA